MKIKFCGAAQEVTGSSHLITLEDGYKILLDCGLYQGSNKDMDDFNASWQFKPEEIDCLIVSHSHIDHTGRIPKLVKDGFRGKIYATHATRDLCALMLLDSAKIQESDAFYANKKRPKNQPHIKPLYEVKDAYKAIDRFASFPYEQSFQVHADVRVLFRDAGHILGSASVNLEIKEKNGIKRIAFTGDIGRPNRPILRDPQPMPEADYVITESTYGAKEHETPPNEIERLVKIVEWTCVQKKGKLIIPAFSVGRTQEVVYMLDQLHTAGRLPRIPIYVDSPLAVNATDIFQSHPECFDADMHEYMLTDDNPFGFNRLFYVRSVNGSKNLNKMRKPAIIISASGMMNAGRIQHHLFNNIQKKKNTFLIVGYCAPNTPGGKLRDGKKSLRVFGQNLQVLADIEMMDSFSAHGDRSEMRDLLANQKESAKKIFLVHGTLDRQEAFRDYLQEHGFTKPSIEIPSLGQEFDL